MACAVSWDMQKTQVYTLQMMTKPYIYFFRLDWNRMLPHSMKEHFVINGAIPLHRMVFICLVERFSRLSIYYIH